MEIISEPADSYAYRAGDAIDVSFNMDSMVEVEGAPLLALFVGDGDDSTWRGAEYLSGFGSRNLIFR